MGLGVLEDHKLDHVPGKQLYRFLYHDVSR